MLEVFVREGLGLVGRAWAVVVGKVGFGVGGLAWVSGGPCSWVWGWWVGVGYVGPALRLGVGGSAFVIGGSVAQAAGLGFGVWVIGLCSWVWGLVRWD